VRRDDLAFFVVAYEQCTAAELAAAKKVATALRPLSDEYDE
jgi:hypothetical protein